jgi:hypothetical protein
VAQDVELFGGDAGRHRGTDLTQDLGRGAAGAAHALDRVRVLDHRLVPPAPAAGGRVVRLGDLVGHGPPR